MRVRRYEVGYVSHQGNVRTDNQDSLIIRRGSVDGDEFLMLAVADGMGGFARGGEASAVAMGLLNQWWEQRLPQLLPALDWDNLCRSVEECIDTINLELFRQSEQNAEKSGTTLSMAFIFQGEYRLFQVGDSRIYLVHGGALYQVTKDQTWCQREIDAGRMTPEEASTHNMRHVLVSALGAKQTYQLDCLSGKLENGHSLLLCSDGFYQELPQGWPGKDGDKRPVQEMIGQTAQEILKGKAPDNLTAVQVRMTKAWR